MTQSLVTVVVPIDGDHKQVNAELDRLRNLSGLGQERLELLRDFVHFMSFVVLPKDDTEERNISSGRLKRGATTCIFAGRARADGHQDAVLERPRNTSATC
jgi:hypothetical protein